MAFTEVVTDVWVDISRKERTSTTVVVNGRSAVLVDPAWLPDELAGHADFLDGYGLTVSAGISTHAHHDHLLWHPRFGDAPRWASARSVELATEYRTQLVEWLGPDWPADLARLVGDIQAVPGPLVPAPFGSAGSGSAGSGSAGSGSVGSDEPVELVEHDGHAPGHVAVWLPERRVLLAGDMLSDVELPLPLDPDDLDSYLAGLDTLAPYVARAQVLVPGHGSPTSDPSQRLAADRRYLDAVITGAASDDLRIGNPGMGEVHARITAAFGQPSTTPGVFLSTGERNTPGKD